MGYTEHKHLNKIDSDSLMARFCPGCEYEAMCTQVSANGDEKVCLIRSYETLVVWVRISEAVVTKVQPPCWIGNVAVLKEHHKDAKGNKYYECWDHSVRDDPRYCIRRGDNLLRAAKRSGDQHR